MSRVDLVSSGYYDDLKEASKDGRLILTRVRSNDHRLKGIYNPYLQCKTGVVMIDYPFDSEKGMSHFNSIISDRGMDEEYLMHVFIE